MILLGQMVVLLLYMLIGFFCGKKGFLSDSASKHLSWIVLNIANPAMILNAGMDKDFGIRGQELLFMFLLALCVFGFLILLGYVIPMLLRAPADETGIYRVMTVFNNIGFMGVPILSAAYGPESLLYASLFLFPFNFLIYTFGIACIKGKAERSDTGEGRKVKGFSLEKAINVGTVSCVLALVIYMSGVTVPDFIHTTAQGLSGLTAPLSMMVIGQSMVHISLKDMLGDVRLLVFSAIKLVLIPIAGIVVLRLFITDPMILHVCYIMLATPIGSMCAMLSQQYGGNYFLASRGVTLTTILSVVTIPLVSLLLFGV